ncbi:hypothetical protein M1L60_21815 [Actinoplanes sp. TRM 88003]|uniref:Amino acid transporter n=1 Tax=Paractinoplanes aksuensis TaxID=2939490 RepID=A0ABT1DQV9_9ACTN|nr:hypothetical protein [Actinoplanes aksuensis]MCO8273233.1 hypothetical protein [Actinoplanes aksuensis]
MGATDTRPAISTPQKLTLMTMTAMVVGSMVGAGVFSLPRRFAQETAVLGSIIAWVIAGAGMLMLAFVFQTGVTLWISGHVERRVSPRISSILDRVAGILLTSIAVILLANGFTDLVQAAL